MRGKARRHYDHDEEEVHSLFAIIREITNFFKDVLRIQTHSLPGCELIPMLKAAAAIAASASATPSRAALLGSAAAAPLPPETENVYSEFYRVVPIKIKIIHVVSIESF